MFNIYLTSLTISILMYLMYTILFFDNNYSEKKTPFECGFEPLSDMRMPFSMRFFILMVLFLIFDIEISLMFPMFSMMNIINSSMLVFSLTSFFLILLLGLFHEWNEGALDWTN
uniref:NADH-ubiquinone oxidoreductase chain 3 n=1 Tax=Planorbis planorbis TaxID=191805 RepID=A0A7M4C8R1_9GAST|nr:NADH dehydrogenase subunit 3 [Planorbis planorbis]